MSEADKRLQSTFLLRLSILLDNLKRANGDLSYSVSALGKNCTKVEFITDENRCEVIIRNLLPGELRIMAI